jgi:hypothetical protein
MYYRNPIKCTTRLNDGIFRVHRFSVVTPLDYTNRILYFDSTYTAVHLTTHRGIYYLHVEQFLALYALMGFFLICLDYWCAFCLCFGLWFGMKDYRLVVYREVGSIPEELLLGLLYTLLDIGF